MEPCSWGWDKRSKPSFLGALLEVEQRFTLGAGVRRGASHPFWHHCWRKSMMSLLGLIMEELSVTLGAIIRAIVEHFS